MIITAIKAQVKNTERLSVYVDSAYAFSLGYNQLLEQKLHAGLELSEARLTELKHISEFGKAYERALLFAMLRPRSVREMYDYARRKNLASEDIDVIITALIAKKYVDDAYFARVWVENRMAGRKTSQRKLLLELKQKGIADDIASQALAGADFSDASALTQLITKKRKLARYATDDQKLMRYLAGQGFGFDEIKAALHGEEQD